MYLQEDTNAVDLMHARPMDRFPGGLALPDLGGASSQQYSDPRSATIGDLLQHSGDECLYTYDLGDCWYHKLTLEMVIVGEDDEKLGVEGASGKVELLGGMMRCPDEDGGGCESYQADVLNLLLQIRRHPDDVDAIRRLGTNCFEERRNAINVMGSFRPTEFDIDEHREALAEALSSRNSSRNSVKMMTSRPLPMARIGQQSVVYRKEHQLGQEDGYVRMMETVNVKPDPRDCTLCYQCGSPYGRGKEGGATQPLRACSRCHIPHYCCK